MGMVCCPSSSTSATILAGWKVDSANEGRLGLSGGISVLVLVWGRTKFDIAAVLPSHGGAPGQTLRPKIRPQVLTKNDAAMLGAPTIARRHGKAAKHAATQRRRIALDPSASTEVGISQRAVAYGIDG